MIKCNCNRKSQFSSGQLLNNLLNPFSEKERESTANCSMWTQWVRQQSTTAMLRKSLDRLNFSTDPRFSFFTRPRSLVLFFHSTSCIAFLFCGSNRPIPISRFACLCSNCSIMSRLCHNVQIISLYQMKNTLLLLLLWPITALGYYGLALSMSSIGFQFCIFTPHKYNYDQNLMNG